MKTFLKTGEFARLCRTTKETLFHYDREGILSLNMFRPTDTVITA